MPSTPAYVRTADAPKLPPPANMTGLTGWLLRNLFPNPLQGAVSIAFGALLLWLGWSLVDWGIVRATWTGENREACLGANAGACWPFVWARLPQWIYGFYPLDERWRVNICFFVGALALVPMMIPSAPYKAWNALFLLTAFPLMTLILLTGGNFDFSLATFFTVIGLFLLAAAAVPLAGLGLEEGVSRNRIGLGLAGAGLAASILSWFVPLGSVPVAGYAVATGSLLAFVLLLGSAGYSLLVALSSGDRASVSAVVGWSAALVGVVLVMILLGADLGLVPVETSQWGGLLVTLVVAVTGIVASLPLGILLALGRRSNMPAVKLISVVFIEVWRGVPLITVLFMASVMLPLFLPEGVNFDKLLRALIGVAIFSAAYMAEVVRGGLQAIPKGQYEGARALGLSFWQMMGMIILPQALKISIPNIVSNFIGLFKDTTLVSIIGIFDVLGIVQSSFADAKWASPNTGPTGYLFAALMFWVFCFSMSRYSIFTERRLATGHKR